MAKPVYKSKDGTLWYFNEKGTLKYFSKKSTEYSVDELPSNIKIKESKKGFVYGKKT